MLKLRQGVLDNIKGLQYAINLFADAAILFAGDGREWTGDATSSVEHR